MKTFGRVNVFDLQRRKRLNRKELHERQERGKRLRLFRKAAGLTQAQVAAAVGVSEGNYANWEHGTHDIRAGHLGKLAETLGTTPDAIMGYASEPLDPTALASSLLALTREDPEAAGYVLKWLTSDPRIWEAIRRSFGLPEKP